MGRLRVQLVIETQQFPTLTARAALSSWADVAREAFGFYDWAVAEASRGGRLRLADAEGQEAVVVIPGLGLRPEPAGAQLAGAEARTEVSSSGLLEAVERVITDAKAASTRAEVGPPIAPGQLRTREDAVAALQAAVWWAGRPGVPTIPLGQEGVQLARLNSAPIAVLGSILICPGASKSELDDTVAFVMSEVGGKVPTTDSVGFWTSPNMQKKHGYVIDRANGQYTYRDELPMS